MKKLLTLLLCLVLGLSLAACGSGESGNEGNGDGAAANTTMVVGLSGDPQSFHPDYKSDDNAWPINQNIFNRLVKLGPNDNVILDLAESYEFSEDGLTLTFHLREGVKWHDGEPFTSADVKWTYDTMKAEVWSKSDSLANVESIECPDDLTVVMNLFVPDVSIIAKLSWYGTFILPKHLYEGQDTATCEYNMNPVGTGPFKFVSFENGVSVTLEANEDFFGGAPAIKTLIYSIIPDQNTQWEAYINNEIDIPASVPNANVHDLDGNADYEIFEYLSINRTYVTINFKNDKVNDPAIRQAIALGVDRKGMYDRTMNGVGGIATTFVSPVFTQFADEQYQMPERDIDAAIKVLEDAGYTRNEDGYFMELNFDVFISGNFVDIANIFKANMEEIGIKINVNAQEMGAWQDKVLMNHDFEITMLAGYQGPDVSGLSGRIHTTGGTNIGQYSNPEVDRLLDLAITQSDVAERAATMSEIQRIMSEELPLILLIDNGSKWPVRKTITGTPRQLPDELASSEMSKAAFTE